MAYACPETGQAAAFEGYLPRASGDAGAIDADRPVEIRSLPVAALAGRRRASSLLAVPPAHAQVAAGYSEYYIPGDETNMRLVFNTLDAAGTNYGMHAVIAVTAWSANTTVYYDHWEDGYDFDPANPGTADETVILANTGDQRIFESANIPTNPRGTATYYDGGDRIYVAGGVVTVTRASWIEAVGVGNQSAAWEIYPVKPQLTDLRPAVRREPGLRRLQPGVRARPGHGRQHHVHRGPERRRIRRHRSTRTGTPTRRIPATRPRSRCSEARPSSSTA